jgi:hypothetical protein
VQPQQSERTEDYRREIIEIPSLRVTEVQSFEACPLQWHEKRFVLPKGESGPYARIGTAVHKVIELFVLGQLGGVEWSHIKFWLHNEGVSDDEIENCYRYLGELRNLGLRPIAVEIAFELSPVLGQLPLTGHMDLVGVARDGALTIVDHKTNRSRESVNVWRHRLQPVLYAWAARQLWPRYETYRFIIGYVNLHEFVQWDIDGEMNDELAVARYWQACREMQTYAARGQYEARLNDGCRFCPIKSRCPRLNAANNELLESIRGLK